MGSQRDQWQEDQSGETKRSQVRQVRLGWTGERQEGEGQGSQQALPSEVTIFHLAFLCLAVFHLSCLHRMYCVQPHCPSL